ncbi:MAG TPA: amidase [Terriglobales bacterium]|nr:amidase [Terriglobales bacterium]
MASPNALHSDDALYSDDILYLSVRELGQRIRARKLSPVKLAESYLERSQTLGAKLNAYATLTPEITLKEAAATEREIAAGKYRGPLHGIPYAAKDLLAVAGYPTTWGARPFAGQKFDYDATVIERLRAAGAVLLGKAAMIELAGGMGYHFGNASISGPAHNPWNEECWTCGSSAGSGAIVAAGLAGFAIGTETWGSIVCPSAYCGVSGLRPTYGRVSRHGAMALSFSMDKIGPMARSADDCGLILSAIAGHDPADPGSLPPSDAAFTYSPEGGTSSSRKKPLRVGWLKNQWKKMDAGVEAAFKAAVEVLKKNGCDFSDAELPDGKGAFGAAAGTIISVEGCSAFEALIDSGRISELVDDQGRLGGYINRQIPASDFLRAMRIRAIVQKKIEALFEKFDVLCAASLPVAATKLSEDLDKALDFADPIGGIGNLCGLPAISVPCGFTEGKLPVGIQFIGPPLGEDAVLRAARTLQQHTDWHKQRPPVA